MYSYSVNDAGLCDQIQQMFKPALRLLFLSLISDHPRSGVVYAYNFGGVGLYIMYAWMYVCLYVCMPVNTITFESLDAGS